MDMPAACGRVVGFSLYSDGNGHGRRVPGYRPDLLLGNAESRRLPNLGLRVLELSHNTGGSNSCPGSRMYGGGQGRRSLQGAYILGLRPSQHHGSSINSGHCDHTMGNIYRVRFELLGVWHPSHGTVMGPHAFRWLANHCHR